ncbi:helix-turn-helix domain-containing protein [Tsukamurella pulmonis]|uniref:helix-turn-helix domain-containing protein n=1 Tax=Tsukamurella pulmonis TaxID=47312 RepID=UPI000A76960C|nr:helix-turn-helix transcriptional regulator [Tsukamurella pulmonis]
MATGYELRIARWNRELKRRKIAGPSALAREIGMDKGTCSRVMNQKAKPGVDFARKCSDAWGLEIPDLFA